MWWLGLFFEHLALDLAGSGTGFDADPAVRSDGPAAIALCDRHCVLDASKPARDHGIEAGMKRATAQALLPSLHLLERNADAERQALEAVAIWMQQFTPTVSLQSGPAYGLIGEPPTPCGLLAEVAPSLRYFGGLRALCTQVRQGLQSSGYHVRIGVAPTAGAAWLLARHRDASFAPPARLEQEIGRLPVSLLVHDRAQLEWFRATGIQQVHELLALPRAAIARRFGPALLEELDRALGRRPEPRSWFEAPPVFDQRLELLTRVEHAEALMFAADRLLASMTGWLGARQSAIRAFTLHIEHDECDETAVDVRLAGPAHETGRLSRLLREKLTVTRLPEAARAVRLRAEDIVARPGISSELFPSAHDTHEELCRLVERLQARLGAEHVRRVRLIADHRPESAWRFETCRMEADDVRPSANGWRDGPDPSSLPVARLPRPLWLLDPALPLAERNHRPWWRSALQLQAGPERIEGGWWDGRLVQRDYFIATDDAHMLYWIYRERLHTGENGAWFLHGRFG